jgi:hypothetical protein
MALTEREEEKLLNDFSANNEKLDELRDEISKEGKKPFRKISAEYWSMYEWLERKIERR